MDPNETEEAMRFADAAIREAGRIALAHFRRPLVIDDKGADGLFDPVTQADREVETCLRRLIGARYPDHAILGEEQEDSSGSSRYSWIIDPVDGTRAFISGVPAWGILLGLRCDGRCIAGLMHQPYLEEVYAGSPGGGWFERRDERRVLRTRAEARLADAILYSTHPDMFAGHEAQEAFLRVARRCRLMRYGGDCYSYCLLALGHIDLVIEDTLKPFDIQPLVPIIEAAGGVVTGRDGGDPQQGGFIVAAANHALHRQALELLAR